MAPPDSFRENALHAKIAAIAEKYPDFLDPWVHTVGITDTKHGEDRCWSEYFSCAADVNSPDPFFPFVSMESKAEEIHSARLNTRDEKGLSPFGIENSDCREFLGYELEDILADEISQCGISAAKCFFNRLKHQREVEAIEADVRAITDSLSRCVNLYNRAPEHLRR